MKNEILLRLKRTNLAKLNKFERIAIFQLFLGTGVLTYFIRFYFGIYEVNSYFQAFTFLGLWGTLIGLSFFLSLFILSDEDDTWIEGILELTLLMFALSIVVMIIYVLFVFFSVLAIVFIYHWFVIMVTLGFVGWLFVQLFIVKIIMDYGRQKDEEIIEER